jgi:hypothetical protein
MRIRALFWVMALSGNNLFSKELNQFEKNRNQLNQICNLSKEEALGLIARGLISTEKLNRYLRSCADQSAPMELDLSNMNIEDTPQPSQSVALKGSEKTAVAAQPSKEFLNEEEVATKNEIAFNPAEKEIIVSSESAPFVQGKGSLRQFNKELRSQSQEATSEVVMICCKKREYSYLKYCRGMVNQMVPIPRLEYLWLQSKTQQALLPEAQTIASH